MKAVSFNVLADAYISYGDYSHVSPELLIPQTRIKPITQLLRSLDADVIGLQEADEALSASLNETGEWQTFWTQKGNDKPDGCLTLVKHDIAVSDFKSLEYSDGSGHIAQFIKIGEVVLANTHIKWAPIDSLDHVGVKQAEELIDSFESDRAVLFADCNDRPNGPVREVIEKAGFVSLSGDIPTALVDQKAVSIDILATRAIQGRGLTQSYDLHQIPNTTCPSDHIPIEAQIDYLV